MKLYTEQTLRNAINQVTDGKLTELSINAYINSLTPIELPSDEEIEDFLKNTVTLNPLVDCGIKIGAKWVIDKIKNQQ